MAHSLLILFTLLLAGFCNAGLPSERYWHRVMPNTPIPDAIRVFMYPEPKPKGASADVGKGGVNVKTSGTTITVGPNGKPGVYRNISSSTYTSYFYPAAEDQIHDDFSVAYFFLEKDLHANQKMNLQFMKTTPGATFLPRQAANSIPFSSSKYPEILTRFSVAPGSVEAVDMKQTLQECEEPTVNSEAKYCATSLESMVDFTTSKLGTSNVQVLATKIDSKESPKQLYKIAEAPVKVEAAKSVACHSQRYPYAVFYCHETRASKAYLVPLVGVDGSKVKAVAVCHEDTSAWNPKHLAFQLLKVKPGTVPVCHFLPQDHLLWVSASK